jgi:hypothetical protein
MSEPKWTPGPWIADDLFMENGNHVRVGTNNGRFDYFLSSTTICECFVSDDLDDDNPRIGIVTAERNARLLAAAPKLYDALNRLICALDAGDHPPHDSCLRVDARAALAKACGE